MYVTVRNHKCKPCKLVGFISLKQMRHDMIQSERPLIFLLILEDRLIECISYLTICSFRFMIVMFECAQKFETSSLQSWLMHMYQMHLLVRAASNKTGEHLLKIDRNCTVEKWTQAKCVGNPQWVLRNLICLRNMIRLNALVKATGR